LVGLIFTKGALGTAHWETTWGFNLCDVISAPSLFQVGGPFCLGAFRQLGVQWQAWSISIGREAEQVGILHLVRFGVGMIRVSVWRSCCVSRHIV